MLLARLGTEMLDSGAAYDRDTSNLVSCALSEAAVNRRRGTRDGYFYEFCFSDAAGRHARRGDGVRDDAVAASTAVRFSRRVLAERDVPAQGRRQVAVPDRRLLAWNIAEDYSGQTVLH